MGSKTKIEWCDLSDIALSTIYSFMAPQAQSTYIKPVRTSVSKMVVVFLCRISALTARQAFRRRKAAFAYCIADGSPSALLNCLRLFSCASRATIALVARGRQSIRSGPVNRKLNTRFPKATLPTELFSGC